MSATYFFDHYLAIRTGNYMTCRQDWLYAWLKHDVCMTRNYKLSTLLTSEIIDDWETVFIAADPLLSLLRKTTAEAPSIIKITILHSFPEAAKASGSPVVP